MELWLSLFNAETEEDLEKLEELSHVMKQVIEAYRSITAAPEFHEMERLNVTNLKQTIYWTNIESEPLAVASGSLS